MFITEEILEARAFFQELHYLMRPSLLSTHWSKSNQFFLMKSRSLKAWTTLSLKNKPIAQIKMTRSTNVNVI